jgi:glycogen operon protein
MGFANDVSIGAPPDPFSAAGQNWHLPPPIAGTRAANACLRFRDLLVANMRHAGALRIDHVMGLARLFWIPAGAAPVEGAYIRYPEDTFRAILALASDRAQCLVVGEDLGTVPEGMRERLAAADVLSYRVVWFERDGVTFTAPARYPVKSATCVSTHDLPTIAGWWEGADIAEKLSLGLTMPADAEIARAERLTSKRALVEAIEQAGVPLDPRVDATAPHDATITAAIHRYACASTSALVLIQADDLAGETVALNLPGTDRARPNWRRKVQVDVAALWETPPARQLIVDCAGVRTGG